MLKFGRTYLFKTSFDGDKLPQLVIYVPRLRAVRRNYFGYVIIIVIRIRNERRRADLIEEFKDLRLSPLPQLCDDLYCGERYF